MNVDTGKTYPSLKDALDAGESPDDVVAVEGTKEQLERLANNVAAREEEEALGPPTHEELKELNRLKKILCYQIHTKPMRRKRNKIAKRSRRRNRK